MWRTVPACIVCLLLIDPTLKAQDTPEAVRKLARNPFANVIKIPFEEDVTFGQGVFKRTGSCLQIQPLFPIPITQDWLVVTRVVGNALVYQPRSLEANGGTTGVGDFTASFFFTPMRTGKIDWGVGPAILVPTATDLELGLGKWGLGPTFAVVVQPEWGSFTVLVQNLWSVAGRVNSAAVSQLQLQPSLSYNLPHGWYLAGASTVNVDWTRLAGQRCLTQVGGGAGRSFNLGKQALDSNLIFYWNAIRAADQLSPKWQVSAQFSLLFSR